MRFRRLRWAWVFPVVLASAALLAATGTASTGQCLVPGTGKPLYELWHPDMLAAIGYTDTRTGDVAFAVRTSDGRFYGYRPDHQEWSASVVKAMLMVAYLDEPYVSRRALNAHDKSLLGPMITESDNDDAQVVFDTVGHGALRALANRVGMTHFATSPIWGETEITARGQTTFFLHIDSDIVARHRAYAMSLLAGIVPSERWGVGEVAPRGWKLYFKGGWGYGTGLLDHQVALLVRGARACRSRSSRCMTARTPMANKRSRASSNDCSTDCRGRGITLGDQDGA